MRGGKIDMIASLKISWILGILGRVWFMQGSKDFIILRTLRKCKIRLENEYFCRM